MANKVVIFPAGKETEARTYAAWADTQYGAIYDPTSAWAYVRNDTYGQWVVPFLGPPAMWDANTPILEPMDGEAMRSAGVLHDYAIWPVEEE